MAKVHFQSSFPDGVTLGVDHAPSDAAAPLQVDLQVQPAGADPLHRLGGVDPTPPACGIACGDVVGALGKPDEGEGPIQPGDRVILLEETPPEGDPPNGIPLVGMELDSTYRLSRVRIDEPARNGEAGGQDQTHVLRRCIHRREGARSTRKVGAQVVLASGQALDTEAPLLVRDCGHVPRRDVEQVHRVPDEHLRAGDGLTGAVLHDPAHRQPLP